MHGQMKFTKKGFVAVSLYFLAAIGGTVGHGLYEVYAVLNKSGEITQTTSEKTTHELIVDDMSTATGSEIKRRAPTPPAP